MSTCNLRLYIDTKLDEHKNYVIDSIETYLSSKTYIDISNFQYQRFELYKTIKVDLSQDYQTKLSNINRYDYLRVSFTTTDETIYYYYYVTAIRQKAESTIELELKMDVLNTFSFSTTASNSTYTLSDRSLITREHKDRIDSTVSFIYGNYYKFVPRNPNYILNTYFLIDWNSIINDTNAHTFTFGDVSLPPSESIGFKLHCYNTEDGTWYSEERLFSQIILQYDLAGDGSVDIKCLQVSEDLSSISVYNDQMYEEEMWFIEFTGANITSSSYIAAFRDFIYYTNLRYVYERYKRIIDQFQEGIEAITFKTSETQLNETDSNYDDWYIAYSSANAVVQDSSTSTQSLYVNPVQVDFFSDKGYTLTTSSPTIKRIYTSDLPNYNNYEEWLAIDLTQLETGGYVEVNGVQYTSSGYVASGNTYTWLWVQKKNNTDYQFRRVCPGTSQEPAPALAIYENVGYIDFYGLNACELIKAINNGFVQGVFESFYIGSGSSTFTGTSSEFTAIDLTDPKLIKIIECPYAPREDLKDIEATGISDNEMVWNSTLNCLELKYAQENGFNRNIQFEEGNPYTDLVIDLDVDEISNRDERDIKYESKLYHSDYYQPKFVYDSFTFIFRYEDIDIDEMVSQRAIENFIVQYAVSGNVQSKFIFKFNQYICKRELQDYNNVLIVERNNEKAIFNNAYINYIRSGGFRYDTKNADAQKMVNGITTTLSTIGSIASFASTPWTGAMGVASGVGLAIGTATKIITSIHSAQQNDRAIAQKLLSASQQSTSVSTSEDVDIMKIYNNNKAKLCYYEVSDYLKDALWDLFHYYGYKCQEHKIPDVTTRCNFNFVQGEIVLDQYNFNEDIANEIINKWRDGITFFHKADDDTYDIEQQYENFEVSLL